MPDEYTIGQLARAADVPTSTVRYYERRGLLSPPGRSASKYRRYDAASLRRLQFVRAAQQVGFTLANIGTLLGLDAGRDSPPCQQVQALLAERLKQVSSELAELRRTEETLQHWTEICREAERAGRCGVLDGLHHMSTA